MDRVASAYRRMDRTETTPARFYERALDAEERALRAERKLAVLERTFMDAVDWERRAVKLREALQGIVESDLSAEGMKSAATTILTANRWEEDG